MFTLQCSKTTFLATTSMASVSTVPTTTLSNFNNSSSITRWKSRAGNLETLELAMEIVLKFLISLRVAIDLKHASSTVSSTRCSRRERTSVSKYKWRQWHKVKFVSLPSWAKEFFSMLTVWQFWITTDCVDWRTLETIRLDVKWRCYLDGDIFVENDRWSPTCFIMPCMWTYLIKK